MLDGIHFLLTYTCNFECDHCFLYCSPYSEGTFTVKQISEILNESKKIGTVEWIYFEGGEPFLYFPLLIEGIRRAHELNFEVGVVTNAYGALAEEDAELWLRPMAEAGVSFINISNDALHYGSEKNTPASIAIRIAERLGIAAEPISIDTPTVKLREGKIKSLTKLQLKFLVRIKVQEDASIPADTFIFISGKTGNDLTKEIE